MSMRLKLAAEASLSKTAEALAISLPRSFQQRACRTRACIHHFQLGNSKCPRQADLCKRGGSNGTSRPGLHVEGLHGFRELPLETPEKVERLSYAAKVEDFLDVWRWNDWNSFKIRCVGALPVITTWINDLKIAEVDMATVVAPNYDPEAVLALLGDRGHIALEVHDNDPLLGEARWGVGAKCRWRNIQITDLSALASNK